MIVAFKEDLTDGSGQVGFFLCSEKQVYEIICIVKIKDKGRNSVAYTIESANLIRSCFMK